MNRRQLLTYAGAAGLFGVLAPRLRVARAAPAPANKRRLILVMARGGWDPTFALDPKTQSTMIDVPAGSRQLFGNLPVFTDASRPNVTAYFNAHGARTTIVRGISVASVSHIECVKRMATGTRSETNADMGAIVAHDNGNELPMPYLILGDTAFAGKYAVSAGRVGNTNQIIALLDPAQAYQTDGRAPVVTTDAEDALIAAYADATVERERAVRGANGYNKARLDDFREAIDRGKQLKSVRAGFGSRGRALTIPGQVQLALDALQQGISQCAMISTRFSWDSHEDITEQTGFHEDTFAALTGLMDGLVARPGLMTGSRMIEDTTVIVFSEMGRTPKRNAGGGKDHWPVTSAMVMGAGIRGGRAFGATTDKMEAAAVDFQTGAPSASGRVVTSTHFVAGVLKACGVDPSLHLGPTEVFGAFVA